MESFASHVLKNLYFPTHPEKIQMFHFVCALTTYSATNAEEEFHKKYKKFKNFRFSDVRSHNFGLTPLSKG